MAILMNNINNNIIHNIYSSKRNEKTNTISQTNVSIWMLS